MDIAFQKQTSSQSTENNYNLKMLRNSVQDKTPKQILKIWEFEELELARNIIILPIPQYKIRSLWRSERGGKELR